jgi:hypothetical protein
MGTRRSRNHISYVAATLDADTVTNTTDETAFDQTLTVPAGTAKVGDRRSIRAVVKTPTTNSTNTLTLKLKIADLVIAETAAIDVADGDVIVLEGWYVQQAVGAGSTAAITGGGISYLSGATSISKAKAFGRVTSANFATTTDEDITVTATWSAASTSNIAKLESLDWDQTDGKLAA